MNGLISDNLTQSWPFNKRSILLPVHKGDKPLTAREIEGRLAALREMRDNEFIPALVGLFAWFKEISQ